MILNPLKFLNPFYWRQRKLMRKRNGLEFNGFLTMCEQNGIDKNTASKLWHEFGHYASVPGFQISPNDNLGYALGMGAEELDDLLTVCCDHPKPTQLNLFKRIEESGSDELFLSELLQIIGSQPK